MITINKKDKNGIHHYGINGDTTGFRKIGWYEKNVFPHIDIETKYNVGVDVGCGNGRFSYILSSWCKKLYVIDPIMNIWEEHWHPNMFYQRTGYFDFDFKYINPDVVFFLGSFSPIYKNHGLKVISRLTNSLKIGVDIYVIIAATQFHIFNLVKPLGFSIKIIDIPDVEMNIIKLTKTGGVK